MRLVQHLQRWSAVAAAIWRFPAGFKPVAYDVASEGPLMPFEKYRGR